MRRAASIAIAALLATAVVATQARPQFEVAEQLFAIHLIETKASEKNWWASR